MNSILRKIIPFSIASNAIIILNLAVIGFHILVLTKIIPFSIVWAGRLKSEKEMYVFGALSIIINLFLILTVLTKTKKIKINISQKIINVTLWAFVIVFVLNTFGNLTSKTNVETYVATPLTFILAILCWRVAIENTGKRTYNRQLGAMAGGPTQYRQQVR